MRRTPVTSAAVFATIYLAVAAAPGVAARQQPDRPAPTGHDDRTNPPSGAGGPPSGEQNRSAAQDQGRDPRGNDRDLTTERSDRREPGNRAGGDPTAQGNDRESNMALIAVMLAALCVVAVVYMRAR